MLVVSRDCETQSDGRYCNGSANGPGYNAGSIGTVYQIRGCVYSVVCCCPARGGSGQPLRPSVLPKWQVCSNFGRAEPSAANLAVGAASSCVAVVVVEGLAQFRMGVQVGLQNDLGGHLIASSGAFAAGQPSREEQSLGLDGGESLIPQVNGETWLTGPVADQAALHGLLDKIRDVGLDLLSVEQIRHDE